MLPKPCPRFILTPSEWDGAGILAELAKKILDTQYTSNKPFVFDFDYQLQTNFVAEKTYTEIEIEEIEVCLKEIFNTFGINRFMPRKGEHINTEHAIFIIDELTYGSIERVQVYAYVYLIETLKS